MNFTDRRDAGRHLSEALLHLRGDVTVVLGLPRGGVPVAFEVARALDTPLDVIVVRKLGVPFQPELAMGAIGEGGVTVIDHSIIDMTGVSDEQLAAVEEEQRREVEERILRFRGDRPRVSIEGQHVVIVDDGLATGATAKAACRVAKAQGASKITVAVPVCSSESSTMIGKVANEVVCLVKPVEFYAVGQFYSDFTQTSDDEVVHLLEERAAELSNRDRSEAED